MEGLVEYLLDLWHEFREAREWSRADAVRSKLDELGIAIESGPHDTIWRFKGGD
jgi:cysteinyl-tRNA synthetase